MKNTNVATIFAFLGLVAVVLFFPGCGGNVKMGDLPVYPGAVELKAGISKIGDTLAKNMSTDAALRKTIGVGGQTEQRGFTLPAATTWDAVKTFFEKELKARGWESGLGGSAGKFVDVNSIMDTATKASDMTHTMIWSKGKQTLTLLMLNLPAKAGQKELILSLSTR